MTVTVINLTREELIESREKLLHDLRMTTEELRDRVTHETATTAERVALERLDEIAFLLGEQD
ncbi:hypothetical protein B0I33_112180 [Prauserella shujinwangii]|uniref:Uncharacterized protein n=1 Tax=Prauserella shujinwangii TaxID=1453103 RepID=A0A2T0LMR5_9PSEU|nr:hypothetical protein [Prauserella shujinwangii]PRX44302.1 hypothetical protein B0I33_112180 [Prauserella shujinwangii]